jgi:SAM-dependent methyltransferase
MGTKPHHGHGHHDDRRGARQPHRFDPSRAALLDESSRFDYLPPERIVELLDPPRGGTVVDFGAGTGSYAIQIARARPDVTVIAFDEQPEMLERLRTKPEAALANLRTALPDGYREFAGKADRVLALNVLHELGDDALRDLAAAPSQKGFLLVIDWDAATERPVGPPREHTYNTDEAVRRLENATLAVERLAPMRYHFALRARRRQ